jgi:acyl carrier protein
MNTKEKIINIVHNVIDNINEENEYKISKDVNTRIWGGESVLDSLGLINFIVAVEQNIEDDFDVTITLADERAMSQETSPFKSVGTLMDYIEMLLKEKLDD